MKLLSFSWPDYTLFGLMFGLSGAIGIYYGCFKKQETTVDYLFGGKQMKIFPVAMSLVASTLSGVSLVGIPTEIYTYGTQYWVMVASIFVLGFMVNYIYLPVFYDLQLTSAYEYLELRFHKSARTVASFLFILDNIIYMPIIIYAPSLAFNQVTGLNMYLVAATMSFICIFYTTLGGLKAVVWADTLQFTITLATLVFVLIVGTISVGGVSTIWEKAEAGNRIQFFNMNPDPTIRTSFWSVFIGNLFLWTSYVATSASTVQRFLAVPSLADSKKVLIIYIIFTMVTKSIICFLGLIIFAKYFDCDPLSAGLIQKGDQITAYYVLDVASQFPGLSGVFIAGLFTTAMSALSTYLNTVSGIIYTDFVSLCMPPGISELRASNIMRLLTVIVGLMSLALVYVVENLGTITEISSGLSGVTGGCFVGLFTLGLLFPFANRKGALFGTLASFACLSFIVVKTQINVWNHNYHFVSKPLRTDGCNLTFNKNDTVSSLKNYTSEEPFWLFRITFFYYSFMGTFVTLIVGALISWITKSDSDSPVSPTVLSPFVRRFVPAAKAQYAPVDVALQTLQEMKIPDEDDHK